jgi:hypothetical protein
VSPLDFSGGEKLLGRLNQIAANAAKDAELRVGFLEGATYPDGTSVPYIAAIQEFGATVQHPPRQTTIYRKVNARGELLRGGRFVKRSQSNYATEHEVGAHITKIPPRPFFRSMLWEKGPTWGAAIAKILPTVGYDTTLALGRMGELIKGQLQQSIRDLLFPPLAPSTIRRKGFAKPLIDSGHMLNSVDYEVTE